MKNSALSFCPFSVLFFGRAQIHQFWGDFSLKSSIFVIFYMFQQKFYFENFSYLQNAPAKCTFSSGKFSTIFHVLVKLIFSSRFRKMLKMYQGGTTGFFQYFKIVLFCPFLFSILSSGMQRYVVTLNCTSLIISPFLITSRCL